MSVKNICKSSENSSKSGDRKRGLVDFAMLKTLTFIVFPGLIKNLNFTKNFTFIAREERFMLLSALDTVSYL